MRESMEDLLHQSRRAESELAKAREMSGQQDARYHNMGGQLADAMKKLERLQQLQVRWGTDAETKEIIIQQMRDEDTHKISTIHGLRTEMQVMEGRVQWAENIERHNHEFQTRAIPEVYKAVLEEVSDPLVKNDIVRLYRHMNEVVQDAHNMRSSSSSSSANDTENSRLMKENERLAKLLEQVQEEKRKRQEEAEFFHKTQDGRVVSNLPDSFLLGSTEVRTGTGTYRPNLPSEARGSTSRTGTVTETRTEEQTATNGPQQRSFPAELRGGGANRTSKSGLASSGGGGDEPPDGHNGKTTAGQLDDAKDKDTKKTTKAGTKPKDDEVIPDVRRGLPQDPRAARVVDAERKPSYFAETQGIAKEPKPLTRPEHAALRSDGGAIPTALSPSVPAIVSETDSNLTVGFRGEPIRKEPSHGGTGGGGGPPDDGPPSDDHHESVQNNDNEKNPRNGNDGPGNGRTGTGGGGGDDDPNGSEETSQGLAQILGRLGQRVLNDHEGDIKKQDKTIGIDWIPRSAQSMHKWLNMLEFNVSMSSKDPNATMKWIQHVGNNVYEADSCVEWYSEKNNDKAFKALDIQLAKELMVTLDKKGPVDILRSVRSLHDKLRMEQGSYIVGRQIVWLICNHFKRDMRDQEMKEYDWIKRIKYKGEGHEHEYLGLLDRFVREQTQFKNNTPLNVNWRDNMQHCKLLTEEWRKFREADDSDEIRREPYLLMRKVLERKLIRQNEERNYESELSTWDGERLQAPKKKLSAAAKKLAAAKAAAGGGASGRNNSTQQDDGAGLAFKKGKGKGKGKKGKGKGKGKGAAGADNADTHTKPCFAFMRGQCQNGKACLYSHEHAVINPFCKDNPTHPAVQAKLELARAASAKAASIKPKAKAKGKAKAKATAGTAETKSKACWFHTMSKCKNTAKDCPYSHDPKICNPAKKEWEKQATGTKGKGKGKGKKGTGGAAVAAGAGTEEIADR